MNLSIQNLLFVAGLLHFCQVPAMMAAPSVLGWKEDLATLQVINQRIVKVMGMGVMLMVLGMGVVVMVGAPELAAGGPLATSLCGFLTVFWLFRGVVQAVVYRRVMPQTPVGRFSQYGLTILFFFLTGAYFSGFIAAILA